METETREKTEIKLEGSDAGKELIERKETGGMEKGVKFEGLIIVGEKEIIEEERRLSKLEHWIKNYDNAIPDDLCEKIINFFESSPKGVHDASWRKCQEVTNLDYSYLWEEFKKIVKISYDKYREELKVSSLNAVNTLEAPNIFKYESNHPQFFDKHSDSWNKASCSRQISIIIYLNDVEKGGETYFDEIDVTIYPKKGRISFFPSHFNYMHAGKPPISGNKYIVVSWMHFDGEGHSYRVHPI